jgi:hypothetical protein
MSVDDMFNEPTYTLNWDYMSMASLIIEGQFQKKLNYSFLRVDHGRVEGG